MFIIYLSILLIFLVKRRSKKLLNFIIFVKGGSFNLKGGEKSGQKK